MKKFVGISVGLKSLIQTSFIAIALAYFGFHAISGKNGITSYTALKHEYAVKERVYNKLKNDLEIIRRDVNLLRDNNLDLDMLDERCRLINNMSEEDEYVMVIKK